MRKQRRLRDAYRFPGFNPAATVVGIFGDPKARVICLQRRVFGLTYIDPVSG